MLCVWIIALVTVSVCAYAENDPITCSIEVSPEYLAGPGEVNVTITISNATNEDLKDPVVLYSPQAQIIEEFGNSGYATLKAGESKTWTGTYSVNERELAQGYVLYFVKYTVYQDSGEAVPQSQSIRATVSLREAEALLVVDRTISPTSAHEGQEVQVTYTLTNAGTVPLTDITITENDDINGTTQKIPAQLDPGYKAEIPYKVTMGKKDLTSSAKVTYKSETSSKEQVINVEKKTITFAETNLTATLTSSTKGVVAGGTLTLTLELKNKGNSDMTDIRVTDPVLGDVFTNQKVEAGKTLTLEKEITLTESGEYQFQVNGIDGTGTAVSTASNVLAVTAMNPEDALNLVLVATPDRTEVYDDPAGVRFTLSVTNDSKVDATNVKISHGYVDLYTFDSIPAGETRTMSRDTVLSTSGKFQFTATAKDPLENESTFKSNEMQIAVYQPTPVPVTPTPPPEPTPEPTFVPMTIAPIHDPSVGTIPKAIQNVLMPVLIIAGILLVACVMLLAVAAKRRHDRKKDAVEPVDQWERARRRDYITASPEETANMARATITRQPVQPETDDDGMWDLPPEDSGAYAAQPEADYSAMSGDYYADMGDDGFEPSQPVVYPEAPYTDDAQQGFDSGYQPQYTPDAYPQDGEAYADGYQWGDYQPENAQQGLDSGYQPQYVPDAYPQGGETYGYQWGDYQPEDAQQGFDGGYQPQYTPDAYPQGSDGFADGYQWPDEPADDPMADQGPQDFYGNNDPQ